MITNPTLQTLLDHRSIRKYSDKKVDDSTLQNILKAGFRASTTGNMQVYSVIVNRDPEIKKKLWPLHFKQQMVLDAPVLLTFCADFHRFNQWCRLRNAKPGYNNFLSFLTASIDALLVAQNVAIAAESMGLGICYLGTTNYMADEFIESLKLPEHVFPITAITLGYAADNPQLTDRLPDEALIHQEYYHRYSDSDIEKIYQEKENLKFYKDLVIENETDNLAQIFTQKRYKEKDNVLFSEKLLLTLKKQGFL